ncbi:MAG: glycosyltransferase family 2 protein [Patescibacteria group bacterium]
MKLIVQIPCLNEEKTLPLVVNSIPKYIDGIDAIEILIIDDGSTDNTLSVAKKLGVQHVVRHTKNKGLAISFADGIHYALEVGADIIVNTDADNQYPQKDIPRLIQPILNNQAEIVIADRQTAKIRHFSPLKKFLQKVGSGMVRKLSGTSVPDAVSGFRAYSRQAALELNIVTDFSYVIETIIQAQYKRIAIASIPIETNPPTRKSRLFKNMFQHIRQSTATMIRIYTMYRTLTVFMIVGFSICAIGSLFALRFLYFFVLGEGAGHIQSLIFSAILITVGFQVMMTGLIGDIIGINRKLLENMLRRVKNIELLHYKKPRVRAQRKNNGNGTKLPSYRDSKLQRHYTMQL